MIYARFAKCFYAEITQKIRVIYANIVQNIYAKYASITKNSSRRNYANHLVLRKIYAEVMQFFYADITQKLRVGYVNIAQNIYAKYASVTQNCLRRNYANYPLFTKLYYADIA